MGPINFDFRPLFALAIVGFFAVVVGLPVALFFLVRWLWIHLAWV